MIQYRTTSTKVTFSKIHLGLVEVDILGLVVVGDNSVQVRWRTWSSVIVLAIISFWGDIVGSIFIVLTYWLYRG